ncbi:hypothetical protein KDA23_04005 [Candidatus Saccharibacteria bacterium]|nr:hypothetical protein [Candidatus Saccharibacteria bacterium]
MFYFYWYVIGGVYSMLLTTFLFRRSVAVRMSYAGPAQLNGAMIVFQLTAFFASWLGCGIMILVLIWRVFRADRVDPT